MLLERNMNIRCVFICRQPLVPAKLLFTVWNYAEYLADYDQQDAHEFLIALINGWNSHLRLNHHFPFKNAQSPRMKELDVGGFGQVTLNSLASSSSKLLS